MSAVFDNIGGGFAVIVRTVLGEFGLDVTTLDRRFETAVERVLERRSEQRMLDSNACAQRYCLSGSKAWRQRVERDQGLAAMAIRIGARRYWRLEDLTRWENEHSGRRLHVVGEK